MIACRPQCHFEPISENTCQNSILCHCTDIPTPVGVRAEVTADNTSISVSWEWSRQGVLMCVDLVKVFYRPEGGPLMRHTVDNTTATSATLPNLQCNTQYTISVYASGGPFNELSVPRMAYLPASGMSLYILSHTKLVSEPDPHTWRRRRRRINSSSTCKDLLPRLSPSV